MSKKTKAQPKKSTKKAAPAKEATAAPLAAASAPAVPDARLPPPGTLLQKLDRHGAVRCECTIGEDGIHYAGQTYRSLSGAAMAAAKDLGLSNKTQNGYAFWGSALRDAWQRSGNSSQASQLTRRPALKGGAPTPDEGLEGDREPRA